MTRFPVLTTPRLTLRPWRDGDLAPFAALNADPAVMEYLLGPQTRAQSDALAARIRQHFTTHGYGLWAVEAKDGAPFIGFIGLIYADWPAPFTPAVEIGWRLSKDAWGHGYATEGALTARDYAFQALGLDELVSLTVPANLRSRKVMEKIGMTHDPRDDFDHPKVPEGHPLKRHVLYRLKRGDWQELCRK